MMSVMACSRVVILGGDYWHTHSDTCSFTKGIELLLMSFYALRFQKEPVRSAGAIQKISPEPGLPQSGRNGLFTSGNGTVFTDATFRHRKTGQILGK